MLLTVKTQNVYLCILICLFSIYYENEGKCGNICSFRNIYFQCHFRQEQCVVPKTIHTSPMEGIFPQTPHPSGNSSQASYTHFNFWAFDNPQPSRKFQSLLWGNGYFLKLHNEILYFLSSILLSIDLKCEWVHFTPSFLNNENEGNNQQAQKRLLLIGFSKTYGMYGQE